MSIKEAKQFEQNLYNLINNCGLPVDTAFYIFKSVYLDFEHTVNLCARNEGQTVTQEVLNISVDDNTNEE